MCIMFALLIDWLDMITGENYELFILYFLPIAGAAWWAGKRAGILLAAVSAVAWFESDVLSHPAHSISVESWDTAMRLISFLTIALALSKVKEELTREQRLNTDLTGAMSEIKQLRGILPMCSFCRKIRDADGHWAAFERYIADHSDAQVSHGLCPSCYKKHYGEENGT
jgi:K+-sensing histidine kinase KdpD